MMIEAWIRARTEEERTLEFIRNFFMFIAMFGFVFYGVEHWVIGHYLDSWQSRIPFYVSLIGFPLTLAMFFHRGPIVRYPFLIWMAITVLTGMTGALFHLFFNAEDAGVSVFSIAGFLEAFGDPFRPVLAGLAHTHVGAVALVVGLTIRDPDRNAEINKEEVNA